MSIFKAPVTAQERKPLRLWRKVKIHSPSPWLAAVEFETQRVLAEEAHFVQALSRERKRAERSGQHFLLMLLDGIEVIGGGRPDGRLVSVVTSGLGRMIRETDLFGWYRQGQILGVIFTEVNAAEVTSIVEALNAKVEATLRGLLEPQQVDRAEVTFHLLPEATNGNGWSASGDSLLYPQTRKRNGVRKLALHTKRLVDLHYARGRSFWLDLRTLAQGLRPCFRVKQPTEVLASAALNLGSIVSQFC